MTKIEESVWAQDILYKAVVQKLLIYLRKSWVVTVAMLHFWRAYTIGWPDVL